MTSWSKSFKPSAAATPSEPDAEALALGLLTRREHGAGELARKLVQRGVERQQARTLIETLAAQGWQSDQRFAEQFVADHAARGDGPLKIRSALQARGVGAAEIAQALNAVSVDWLLVACAARSKRFGDAAPEDAAARARQLRFLQTRGFTAETARRALQHTFSIDD